MLSVDGHVSERDNLEVDADEIYVFLLGGEYRLRYAGFVMHWSYWPRN
jgi:hypothetical protein